MLTERDSGYSVEVGVARYNEAMGFLNVIGLSPLSKGDLNRMVGRYTRDLTYGKSLLPSSLQMIPTLLNSVDLESLPRNRTALVVELGGTNIRSAFVTVNPDGKAIIKSDETTGKENYHEQQLRQRKYDSVQDFLSTVLAPHTQMIREFKPQALAVIYSFPGDVIETENGIDIRPKAMNKGFVIPGIEDVSIGEEVQRYFRDQGLFVNQKMPIVVLNDTPAVLSSTGSKIGGVVGTGFNLAITANGKIYNTESGGFQGVPLNGPASLVDFHSERPGNQMAEKQISGMYLEQQFNLIIRELVDRGLISQQITEKYATSFISDLIGKGKSVVEAMGGIGFDNYSYAILNAVAGRLRHRSAQLVGAMIGAAIRTNSREFPKGKKIVIPIEGSVFWNIPGYKALVEKYVKRFTGNGRHQIEFVNIEHAGIVGAGVAALSLLQRD